MFSLNPRLEQDSLLLGTLTLCQIRLHKDSRYPWLLLIPVRDNLTEIHHLPIEDQHQLIFESSQVASIMEQQLKPTSMNIAALGNVIPQLHVHHIARFEGDDAWPAPVWGILPSKLYTLEQAQSQVAFWQLALSDIAGFKPSDV